MLQGYNEKNRDLIVNINGKLVHRDQAGVSPFDSAVQGGDAVWEGLRLYHGRIFKLYEHLARLRASAKALDFTEVATDDEIVAQLKRTLGANGMTDGVHIRLTLTRGLKYTSGMDPRLNTSGPTLIILAEHKPPVYDKGGITLVTSSVRRFPPDCLDPKIHHANLIQSILAKIEANHAGADDALMLDTRGFVAETNATHVFVVTPPEGAPSGRHDAASGTDPEAGNAGRFDGVVLTPFCHACPEGITRATVLDLCRENGITARENDVSLAQVYRAHEVFCSGTMGELVPVIKVDGRVVGEGHIGALTRRLSALYRDLTQTTGTPVA